VDAAAVLRVDLHVGLGVRRGRLQGVVRVPRVEQIHRHSDAGVAQRRPMSRLLPRLDGSAPSSGWRRRLRRRLDRLSNRLSAVRRQRDRHAAGRPPHVPARLVADDAGPPRLDLLPANPRTRRSAGGHRLRQRHPTVETSSSIDSASQQQPQRRRRRSKLHRDGDGEAGHRHGQRVRRLPASVPRRRDNVADDVRKIFGGRLAADRGIQDSVRLHQYRRPAARLRLQLLQPHYLRHLQQELP